MGAKMFPVLNWGGSRNEGVGGGQIRGKGEARMEGRTRLRFTIHLTTELPG